MIEVCIAIYQRPYRMPVIVNQLKAQTIQNFNLNIWNNSSEKLDTLDFPKNRLQVINSPANIGSQARFKLVSKTESDTIVFIDDDLILEPDFLEYYIKEHITFGRNTIIGWYSKRWATEKYRDAECYLSYGREADYIGTGGMILDRKIFSDEPSLLKIPPEFARAEDLYLCYLARKRGMKLISIEPYCSMENDDKGQYSELKQYKENAFSLLRNDDWILLKDKTND